MFFVCTNLREKNFKKRLFLKKGGENRDKL